MKCCSIHGLLFLGTFSSFIHPPWQLSDIPACGQATASVYPSCVAGGRVWSFLPSGSCDAPRLKQVFELSLGVGAEGRRPSPAPPPHGQLPPRFLPGHSMNPWVRLSGPGPTTHVSQVYYLGEGETSRQWLQQEPQLSKAELCLSHMERWPATLRARYPTTTPLMWDDMLRDIPGDQLSGQRGAALAGGCGGRGGWWWWCRARSAVGLPGAAGGGDQVLQAPSCSGAT